MGILNQVAGTSISATGLITGAVAVAGAFILNIGIGLYNSFIAVIAAFVNFFIGIIEWVLNAANGGFNSFGDAVANLIGQIISWFLSLGQIVTTIIDAIFGTDWTAGLEGLKNSVTQWGKNENAITLDRMDTSAAGLQRFDYGDAASAGYDFGAGLESKVGSLFNFSGSIPSVEDYAGLIADNANLSTLPDIADNTGKIKDTMSDTDEDLKYLRDMAEMEVINRFTTAEVKVDMSGILPCQVHLVSFPLPQYRPVKRSPSHQSKTCPHLSKLSHPSLHRTGLVLVMIIIVLHGHKRNPLIVPVWNLILATQILAPLYEKTTNASSSLQISNHKNFTSIQTSIITMKR